jgi:transcriptional regulator with XRE-family HTH domain
MYKGHTAKEIAETANVHVTTVYDFLRGDEHCNPTIGTLYALAQAVEEVS